MSTLKEKIEIMQRFEDGETVEWQRRGAIDPIWKEVTDPAWDWASNEYRVKKAMKTVTKPLPFIAGPIAKEQCALIKHFADGGTVKSMPVKLRHAPGVEWEIMGLDDNFNFDYYEYRIVKEEQEPATKEVQLFAWFTGHNLCYGVAEDTLRYHQNGYLRVPKEDKVIEVPAQVFTTSIKGE